MTDPYWRPNPSRLSDHILTVAAIGGRNLQEVIDEWDHLGIALSIKPSLLMAAIRDAEIKANGQPKPPYRRIARWYSISPDHLTTVNRVGHREHLEYPPV